MRQVILGLFACALASVPASAMVFIRGGTDVRADDAAWIQANGPINETTVQDFITFLNEEPDWLPKRIRFNSPGGNLEQGIKLGEELRKRGFATEIGDHEPHPDWPDMPYWDFTRRTPGICASACAYAFMGGIERRIDPGSRIGFHQFSRQGQTEDGAPLLVQQGVEQRIVSFLLNYTLSMGVDGRILVNAGFSSPDEMYWIEAGSEAEKTGLVYMPNAWSGWDIKLLGNGVVAESTRADGKYSMAAYCDSNHGAFFDLAVTEETGENGWSLRSWLVDQCLPEGSYSQGLGAHRIIGNRVDTSSIRIQDRSDGFTVRFLLGRRPVVQGPPDFLYNDAPFGACTTERFVGNSQDMELAILVALRNCID